MTRGRVKATTKGQEKATIDIEPPGAGCRQTPQLGEAAIREVRGLSFVYLYRPSTGVSPEPRRRSPCSAGETPALQCSCQYRFCHRRRHRRVVVELQRKQPATLRGGAQVGGVAEHFDKRVMFWGQNALRGLAITQASGRYVLMQDLTLNFDRINTNKWVTIIWRLAFQDCI